VGDLELSLAWVQERVTNAAGNLAFTGIATEAGEAFDLAGRFEVDVEDDGWFVEVENLSVATLDTQWPDTTVRIESSSDASGKTATLAVDATYANLDDVSLLLPWLPPERQQQLLDLALGGIVRDLEFTAYNLDAESPVFDIDAELEDFGIAAMGKIPGVRGFTGSLSASQERGHVDIASDGMRVDLPELLDRPLDVDSMTGSVTWRSDSGRLLVISDRFSVSTPFLESTGDGDLTINSSGESPQINLTMDWSISDVAVAKRYVPRRIMKPNLYDWLQEALIGGSIPRGTLRLTGPLDKFPFDDDEGKLLVEGTVRGLAFKYHPEWPAAEQAELDIVLDNRRLYSLRNRAMHVGNRSVDAAIEIDDLWEPVLTIDALVTGTLDSLQQFALQSPVDRFTGGNLEKLTLAGEASYQFDLTVPLRTPNDAVIDGVLRIDGGRVDVAGLAAPVTDLSGEIQISRDRIAAQSLGGRFLGEAVALRVAPGDDPRYFTVATATGSATAQAIIDELGLPLDNIIEGRTAYEARILFPRGGDENSPPFAVRITSPLRGMALRLPEPLAKPANEEMLIRGDIRFIPGGERIESAGFADPDIGWQLAFMRSGDAWDLDRGVIQSGGGAMAPAETRGLHLRGRVDAVRLDEWLGLSRARDGAGTTGERIRSVDLLVDNLFAFGQHLEGHRVQVDRSARDWLVQIEGESVVGSVFVPYDFGSDRALVIDMERMWLPGDETADKAPTATDPRNLPPIRLTAADFALGDRRLGSVEVDLARTTGGLETRTLKAQQPTFTVIGEGSWLADSSESLGSRTAVTATLDSTNTGETLRQLDFVEGVTGRSMSVKVDLSWGGGPRADFLAMLDGSVTVRLEDGQLEEVEPGAGRMVGLISFVALPRRLSLDFRDVFSKGFGYDSITGNFVIEDGVASTCDMSLEGPAADIGIVGQVDFDGEQYEQGAVISANVGNTLPLVGAVVGGPPGAAAMLIFSQIFKKPLQEVGQVFYGISGPWQEPAIESVSSDRFVEYGRLAGCLTGEEP
ncbi:MAG: YhdP family protein, partial [Woeseiaceae bacterium]